MFGAIVLRRRERVGGDAVTFEVENFEYVRATASSALLRLRGFWRAGEERPLGEPVLVAESGEERRRLRALPGVASAAPVAGPDAEAWTAAFSPPAALVEDAGTTWRLEIEPDESFALPGPAIRASPTAPSANRLARDLAEFRRRAQDAELQLEALRERTVRELDALHRARDDEQRRAEELERSLLDESRRSKAAAEQAEGLGAQVRALQDELAARRREAARAARAAEEELARLYQAEATATELIDELERALASARQAAQRVEEAEAIAAAERAAADEARAAAAEARELAERESRARREIQGRAAASAEARQVAEARAAEAERALERARRKSDGAKPS